MKRRLAFSSVRINLQTFSTEPVLIRIYVLLLTPAFLGTNARLMTYEDTDTITHEYMGLKLREPASKKGGPSILITIFDLLSFRTPYVAVNWKRALIVGCPYACNMPMCFDSNRTLIFATIAL